MPNGNKSLDAASVSRALFEAGNERFRLLTPVERDEYHRESFALGYALGVAEFKHWESNDAK